MNEKAKKIAKSLNFEKGTIGYTYIVHGFFEAEQTIKKIIEGKKKPKPVMICDERCVTCSQYFWYDNDDKCGCEFYNQAIDDILKEL